MNLVDEAWIPVLTKNGVKQDVSLKDIYTRGTDYADLSVRPHERVALMRFFICIAQAALDGPINYEDWELALEKLPQAAEAYLNKWRESFDLFHKEKPFLQIAGLVESKPSPISKLDFSLATGNNSTLFDQKGDDSERRSLSSKQIAIGLLTFQNFSSGGLLSVTEWGNKKTSKAGNLDSPCLKGSAYHSFVKGKELFKTICLNLIHKDKAKIFYGKEGWGKPVWEIFPQDSEDVNAIKNATETYLGRLVPISRWIKLLSNKEMCWGNGFTYIVFPDFHCPESTVTTTVFNDGKRGILGATHSRAVWRQLASLLVKRDTKNIGRPLVFENIPEEEEFEILVCALLRNQATIEAYSESIFHLPAKMNTEPGWAVYKKEVDFAEYRGGALGRAVEEWRREVDPDWEQKVKNAGKDKNKLRNRLHYIATTHFWTSIEKNLSLLTAYITVLGDVERMETAKKEWYRIVYRTAREAYSLVCGRETPRQMRAYALGLRKLENVQKDNKKKEVKV